MVKEKVTPEGNIRLYTTVGDQFVEFANQLYHTAIQLDDGREVVGEFNGIEITCKSLGRS